MSRREVLSSCGSQPREKSARRGNLHQTHPKKHPHTEWNWGMRQEPFLRSYCSPCSNPGQTKRFSHGMTFLDRSLAVPLPFRPSVSADSSNRVTSRELPFPGKYETVLIWDSSSNSKCSSSVGPRWCLTRVSVLNSLVFGKWTWGVLLLWNKLLPCPKRILFFFALDSVRSESKDQSFILSFWREGKISRMQICVGRREKREPL